MRAIIIDDKDSKALLERLELAKYQNGNGRSHRRADESASVEEMHGWFNYIVVSWLTEQGAKVVR